MGEERAAAREAGMPPLLLRPFTWSVVTVLSKVVSSVLERERERKRLT